MTFKTLYSVIAAAIIFSGCAGIGADRLMDLAESTHSVEIDNDSNGDVDIAFGGTNASTAATARTNLELGSTDDVSFNSVTIGSSTLTSTIAAYLAEINQDLGTGDDAAFNSIALGGTTLSSQTALETIIGENLAPNWDDIADPDANQTINLNTYTNLMQLGTAGNFRIGTSTDYFEFTEASGDYIFRIVDGGTAGNIYIDGIDYIFDQTPATDDTWQGPQMAVIAGESITQWDIVYLKYDTDGPRAYAYDANSTDSDNDTYAPFGIAIEAGTAGNAMTTGVDAGLARNDGWTFTDATDEGKPVYCSEAGDGELELAAPADSGDHVIRIGTIQDEDEVFFNFGFADVTVP